MSARTYSAPLLLALIGCARPAPLTPVSAPAPRVVTSNIARGDYAGSAACERCHSDEYEAWRRSPMHNMTRDIGTAEVHAPFAGEVFRFKRDHAVMETRDGSRYVTIFASGESVEKGTRVFRVSRVIGGHHREDFAGVEVDRVGGAAKNTEERVLPISFLLGERAYRYKGYSVMTPERPGLRPGAPWAKACIFCHNTEPYLDVLLGDLAPGTPPYQGERVDALLPEAQRRHFEVGDPVALRRALDDELRVLGASPAANGSVAEIAAQVIVAIRRRFDAKKLLEVGIGCESCHGGSREHVLHASTRTSLEPHAPYLQATGVPADAAAARAQSINRTCARCHQVLFSAYPYTWEGGLRSDKPPGGSHINSGEARDMLLGACATKLACTACHDPHAPDDKAALAELDGKAGDAVCLGCHERFSTPEAQRAHSHHDPEQAGGRCMGCHMPRKNMTLDARLGRYHRIGSPDDPARVERDRPLECALCHADKRVGELVETMEGWWGKRYDREKLRLLYGELNANVLRATLARGKAHEQASAIYTLGKAGALDAAPLVALQLTNAYPILRYYARDALRSLLGDREIDLHTDDDTITRAAAAWLATRNLHPLTPRQPPAPPTTTGAPGAAD